MNSVFCTMMAVKSWSSVRCLKKALSGCVRKNCGCCVRSSANPAVTRHYLGSKKKKRGNKHFLPCCMLEKQTLCLMCCQFCRFVGHSIFFLSHAAIPSTAQTYTHACRSQPVTSIAQPFSQDFNPRRSDQ